MDHNDLQKTIISYRNKLNKYELFDIFYKLKNSIDFNSTITTPEYLYSLISDIYTDQTPMYQNSSFTLVSSEYYKLFDNDQLNDFVFICTNNSDYVQFPNTYLVDEPKTFEQFKKLSNNVLDLANSDYSKTYIFAVYVNNALEINQSFANKIIPTNLILPIEYVYKTYLGNYFYNSEISEYYSINNSRSNIVILNIPKKTITTTPYNLSINKIIDSNTCLIDKDIYTNIFNKTITEIHK